nr:MAG TPA: hypothetical protein [Caudoviricetes sp.]
MFSGNLLIWLTLVVSFLLKQKMAVKHALHT